MDNDPSVAKDHKAFLMLPGKRLRYGNFSEDVDNARDQVVVECSLLAKGQKAA